MHHTDRTRSHDQDDFPRLYVERILASQYTGERFHQGSHSRIHRFADRDHVALLDRIGRNANIFRESTIRSHTNCIVVGTEIAVACDTLITMTTAGIGSAKYPLPN